MRFRFSIGRKIGLGFGVLIALTLIAFALTMSTIKTSRDINDEITKLYTPSVDALEKLNLLVTRSKMLVSSWIYNKKECEDKKSLKTLVYEEYPQLKSNLTKLSATWSTEDRGKMMTVFSLMDGLSDKLKEVMRTLNSFDSYGEADVFFPIENSVNDEDGEINYQTHLISGQLKDIIERQHQLASEKSGEMLRSFEILKKVVTLLGIALPIGGILVAFFTVRTIVRPVDYLRRLLLGMAKGILPKEKIKKRNDEIGEMNIALIGLVDALKRTTEFANEVGSGKFEAEYKPLSEEDTLGSALLKMRDDLAENERVLEKKVEERTAEVVSQKEEIEMQARKIEVLYNHVTDSIRYAKRIQQAILPPDNLMKRLLPDSFVLYKPKDIVSGDFYWLDQRDGKVLFAAVDCTGHGVPGAFMSIVGYNLLKHVINKLDITQPSLILDELSRGVSESLHQHFEEGSAKDGMDISMCSFDARKKELEFAGAFNPLYLIRDKQLQEIKGNKFPIGIFLGKEAKNFTNHRIGLERGDCIYIFSDGYADQFGGPKGKKFMANQLRQVLLNNHGRPMEEQRRILDSTIEEWKANEEQVDDILVMGVRI